MSEAETSEARPRDLVVVGASAGGVEALRSLVALLPPDLPAAILVVLHVPARGSVLPDILSRAGGPPAAHAVDREPIEPGRIYVAPPDHHLLVEDGRVTLAHGPRQNGHRPAVDPLFRTAASAFGSCLVGIVLSGALDDGTSGLAAVKAAGGLTVAQDPAEALYPSMPRSAIAGAGPDHVLAVAEIAVLLERVAGGCAKEGKSRGEREERPVDESADSSVPRRAGETTARNAAEGELTRYTCPECSGTLWEVREDQIVRLRCRVGHAFTERAFFEEHSARLEAALWSAAMALEERADFSRRLADRFEHQGHPLNAARYRDRSETALRQSEELRGAITRLAAPPPWPEDERTTP